METLVVDDQGTELAFLDSGAPPSDSYTTLFVIHGLVFGCRVWQKLMAIAPASGLRIVAVNRRDYTGSTPLSAIDISTIQSGEDEEKRSLLQTLSVQLATFIDTFSERNSLPPLSADGKTGGFAVVGWSMGCAFALGVASCVDALPEAAQRRFGANLRAVILEDAADGALGMDVHPKAYSPLIDTAIPADWRVQAWMRWMTSYFKHGDLAQRDPDPVEYVVPWNGRAPTIDNMSEAQVGEMTNLACAWTSELPLLINMKPQLGESYEKACFSDSVRSLLPHMKIWAVTGDHTASFSIHAHFKMEADNAQEGVGCIGFKLIPGGNHFMHWDNPASTIGAFIDVLSQSERKSRPVPIRNKPAFI